MTKNTALVFSAFVSSQWWGGPGYTICFFPSRKWTNVFRNRKRKMQLRKRFAELKHSLFLPPRGRGAAGEVRERSPIFTYKILSNKIKFRQDEFVFKSGLTWFIYERCRKIHPAKMWTRIGPAVSSNGWSMTTGNWGKLQNYFRIIFHIWPNFCLLFVENLAQFSWTELKGAEFTEFSIKLSFGEKE